MRGCIVLPLLAVAARADAAPASVVVHVPGQGALRGTASRGMLAFRGVPYAEPPVGDLRWRPTVAKRPWNGTQDATRFGAECPQTGLNGGKPVEGTSESCLYLNIYAPALDPARAPLPVMVWIHGGGYKTGSGNQFNGTGLVAAGLASGHPVVVITINYRLNVFGFAGAAALRRRSPDGGTGHYGIDDQREALRWARRRAAAFGGDGGRVTVFGESGGAHAVTVHLVSPRSFPLYDRAIAESGAASVISATTLPRAEAVFASLSEQAGCGGPPLWDAVDCLIDLPAQYIEAAAGRAQEALGCSPQCSPGNTTYRLPWAPVIDGVHLADEPWALLQQGKHTAAPVIVGSNRDEFGLHFVIGQRPADMSEAQFDAYVSSLTGRTIPSAVPAIKEIYTAADYPYPASRGRYSRWWWAAMRAGSDYEFTCPARWAARELARRGVRAYEYLFGHPAASGLFAGSAAHGAEVPYVFDSLPASAAAAEQRLAAGIAARWAAFAATGDPNAGANGTAADPADGGWPPYGGGGGDALLWLDTAPAAGGDGTAPRRGVRARACDFWDAHGH